MSSTSTGTPVSPPTGPGIPQLENTEEMGSMTLLDHVKEIRDRLFRCAIALVIGSIVGWMLSERTLAILIAPYGKTLIFTTPFEGLSSAFTVSLTISAMLALPFILYQILGFIMPGLYDYEKRWIYIGLPFGLVLFAIGVVFAWYILLPSAIGFLTNIFPTVFTSQLKADEYIPFVTGLLFWMGVAFEMPLIIFILAKANVVNGRFLASRWRYAVVIIAILAAVITPTPDPINMSLVMLPLLVLYGISILLAFLARRGQTVPAILDPEGD